MSRPRIAWFTPLQPVESGISLYSEDLLPSLASVMDIDVIVEDYAPTVLNGSPGLRVTSFKQYRRADYDLAVYQIGNSPAHIYMLEEIERTPGLLVLHDTVLNHLFIQRAARQGTLAEYRTQMAECYGSDGRRAADRVLKGQAPGDLFRFPMSEGLVRSSIATIVHSEHARRQALDWAPDAAVYRVPHGLRMPQYVDRTSARRALRLPDDQFLIASITHINPYKRIDVVLQALRELRRTVPARLILAGSVSPNYPLRRMIAHLGLDQVVDTLGYVTDHHARLIAAAADVIVNLRFPTAGETSGSLLHSMAAGRPVLVSHTGSFTEVRAGAAVPIPVDMLEAPMLLGVLQRLARDPDLGDRIGGIARQFIADEHSMERWAHCYVSVIRGLVQQDVPYPDVEVPDEPIDTTAIQPETAANEFLSSIARDISELGLGGDERLLREVSEAAVELDLGVGKMEHDRAAGVTKAGVSDDGFRREADQR